MKKATMLVVAIVALLMAGPVGAGDKPYHVTWTMVEMVPESCPHFWIDDYGRKIYNLGCTVAHWKEGGTYTGDRYYESLDEAIAFIKEKQADWWGFPQKCSDFKIIWDLGEIIFPEPERKVLYGENSGVTEVWNIVSGITRFP